MLSAFQTEDRHIQWQSQHKERPAQLTKPRTDYGAWNKFQQLFVSQTSGGPLGNLLSRGQTPDQQTLRLYKVFFCVFFFFSLI